MKICKRCNKGFKVTSANPSWQRYCSTKCYHQDYYGRKYVSYERNCKTCGKEFKTPFNNPRKIYCSQLCCQNYRYRKDNGILNRKPKKCKNCGKSFVEKRKVARFCSKKCMYASYDRSRAYIRKKPAPTPRKCKECGVEFTPSRIRKTQYCSAKCRTKAYSHGKGIGVWHKVICLHCEKEFDAFRGNKKFCSRYCAHEHHRKNNKEYYHIKSSNYYHKHRRELNKRRVEWCRKFPEKKKAYDARYRHKKREVSCDFTADEWIDKKKRAKGKCQICNKKVGMKKLTMDHNPPISIVPKGYVYPLKGVIAICKSCNSSKKATLLEEFLKW